MRKEDFLKAYASDGFIHTIGESLKSTDDRIFQLKGIVGSLDAVLAVVLFRHLLKTQLIILHDKEEAAYFHSDIQNLMGDKEVLFFPTSYKRPYEYDETENANILQRAEVLNRINTRSSRGEIIVTYPEALTEKVINKKTLVQNTYGIKTGDNLDTAFMSEILEEYGFERSDFVYEAGQYAIRGGIVDIFSFANDLPYRIELFGDEVESIRTFDPESQLSTDKKNHISIIPNVQTKLSQEKRESFLDYIPQSTVLWFKDVQLTIDVLDKNFMRAKEQFVDKIEEAGGTQVISDPEKLFDRGNEFLDKLDAFSIVECGKLFYHKASKAKVFDFDCKPQPSFNKDFNLVADFVLDQKSLGHQTLIAADQIRQLDRIQSVFEEIDPEITFRPLNIGLRQGFIDQDAKIACFTDHQIFERFYRYKTKPKYSKSKAITLKELHSLNPGDFITHIDYGIGKFIGLHKLEINGSQQEAIRLIFRDSDLLNISILSLHKISKYSAKDGTTPILSKLGSPEWDNKKKKVKKKVQDIARDLIKLYAKRKAQRGFSFSPDSYLQAELESSFIYEDTPDQATSSEMVKVDMEKDTPMDRLVCGDVGFGKTEVAIRAAFKAVCDSKQVAVLVPTTILAMQHYRTFADRLKSLPCKVEYVNRFRTTKQIKETLQRVADGKTDILIGTHRLASKDVKFKDLGLLIIDEEQKFGVKTKEKLREFKNNVDTLTLSATPIPRTLQFSLMGARDMSLITTPPPNRQPVTTRLDTFNEEVIRDAIAFEIRRGGQVFFVHNRIKDIEEIANIIIRLVPDARIGVGHGQMDGVKLEKVMVKFIEGEFDILISTNIIESGLDIPNANTIIINQAQNFGLSDLHQMRGRVGRSNKKAFCYLLAPPTIAMSADSRKRLSALEEFTDLGDGIKVAMRDLDIRGAGDLLGGEQSGFINDIGFDTYHKILDDAVKDLKETEFQDLFQDELDLKKLTENITADCVVETDLQILIPDDYVNNTTERIRLYSQLDKVDNQEELEKLKVSITDRFGNAPAEVLALYESVELRWVAEKIGFTKLMLKDKTLRGAFMEDNEKYFQSETFGKVLAFIQKQPKTTRLKDNKGKLRLIIDHVASVEEAIKVLESVLA